MNLLEEIETRMLLADGDTRRLLIDSGAPPDACIEARCIEDPAAVAAAHLAFADAGADIIRTNSTAANALHLATFGLEHHLNEINWQAAQIARQAVKGRPILVAGSVGPLPAGHGLPPEQIEALYREQVGALLDGGAQAIFFEAFTDLPELLIALEVKYSLHHCPSICTLAWDTDNTPISEKPVDDVFHQLAENNADIAGLHYSLAQPDSANLFYRPAKTGLPFCATVALSTSSHSVSPGVFAELALALASGHTALLAGGPNISPCHVAAAYAIRHHPDE